MYLFCRYTHSAAFIPLQRSIPIPERCLRFSSLRGPFSLRRGHPSASARFSAAKPKRLFQSQTGQLSFQALPSVLAQHLPGTNPPQATLADKAPIACQMYTGNSVRQKMQTTETKSEHIVAFYSFAFGPLQARRKKTLKNEPNPKYGHISHSEMLASPGWRAYLVTS